MIIISQITGHRPNKCLSGLWLHNERNNYRTVKFSPEQVFFLRQRCGMARREGLLKELSHDFGKITAPQISRPHITEILTVPNARQQQSSSISDQEEMARKRPGFNQVSQEKVLTLI